MIVCWFVGHSVVQGVEMVKRGDSLLVCWLQCGTGSGDGETRKATRGHTTSQHGPQD